MFGGSPEHNDRMLSLRLGRAAAGWMIPYNVPAVCRLTLRSGMHYSAWHNTQRNQSKYQNNCFDKNGFGRYNADTCHRMTDCRTCIRDEVVTTVNLKELRAILEFERRHVISLTS